MMVVRGATTWDDRADAARARRRAVGAAVVSLVGQRSPRRDVGSDVERGLELRAVAGLSAGQMKADGQAVEVGLEVDLAREPAARTPQRLISLPPFAPAAETCARTTVLSSICTR